MDINTPGRISKLKGTHECAAIETPSAIECAFGLICIHELKCKYMEDNTGREIGPLFGMREFDTDLCHGFLEPYIAVLCSGYQYCLLNGNCVTIN